MDVEAARQAGQGHPSTASPPELRWVTRWRIRT